MTTALVVDDEPRIAQLARNYLEHAGFAVITASDGRAHQLVDAHGGRIGVENTPGTRTRFWFEIPMKEGPP